MNQEQGVAAPPAAHTVLPPATPLPSAPPNGSASAPIGSRSTLARLAIRLFAVLVAPAFIALATLRWDAWVGHATFQTTNDAYVRAELTRLSSRVAGEVLTVAAKDFQRVKAGAGAGRAGRGRRGGRAGRTRQSEQPGRTAIRDDCAGRSPACIRGGSGGRGAPGAGAPAIAVADESGTRSNGQTATYAKAQADVRASRAVIAAQRHQLEVLSGTKKQRAADLEGAKATLAATKLRLGYTKTVAPFDGVTGERQVQPGDYVNIGSNLINVVPLPNVYVMANYKETQLTRVTPGQPVDITVDSFPNEKLHGRVERISPASGSQFALLPPDNATGNFTKVVQRIPVRIQLDNNQPLLERLLPGMSVVTNINTGEAGANGGK